MAAGKIVDHFTFKRHGTVLKVPVRLHKETERPPKGYSRRNAGVTQTCQARFGVEMDDPKLELWSTDIEALRKAVMDALDDHYSLKWEEWYLVEVSKPYSHDEQDVGIEISYEDILICKTPDGEILHRSSSWRRSSEIHKGMPDLIVRRGADEFSKSLVRATPENTKALKAFGERLVALREQIADFLSPKNINDSLQRALSLLPPALPPPEKKGKVKKVKPLKPSVIEAEVIEAGPTKPVVSKRSPDRPPPMKLRKGTKKLRRGKRG